MKLARAIPSGSRSGSPRFASMNDLDVAQDLRARSHPLRARGCGQARRTCLGRGRGRTRRCSAHHPAVTVPSSRPPTSPRKNATAARGTPSPPGIRSAVQLADPVRLPAEEVPSAPARTSDSNGSSARQIHRVRGLVADHVPDPGDPRPALLRGLEPATQDHRQVQALRDRRPRSPAACASSCSPRRRSGRS